MENGVYVPPVGCYDALTQNSNGTWTLVRKGGMTYTFSSLGLVFSIADIAGNATLIYYNGNNIATIVDPAGRALNLLYSNGILNKITDCVGRVWYFSWNSSYDTQVIYDPPLNGDTNLRYRMIGYDANYNVNTLANRLGQTWYYTYSASNVLQAAYDPSYRSWGLAYVAPEAGISWPATATLQANWTNSRGKVTKYAFDALGQTVGANDATNRLATFAWDTRRNRTDQWTPSGAHTQWGYDGRGNLNSIIDPFGNQTIQTYDYNNGDVLNYVKDARGHETFYNYPTAAPFNGNLLSTSYTRGGVPVLTSYVYWSGGLVKQKTDAENRVTNYTYDQWGHPYQTTVVKDVNTSFVTTTAYSKDSLLATRTDARNRVTKYTYDSWGRLTQKDYLNSSTPSVTLTLDVEGRLTKATDATGTRTFTAFDAWGRCTSMNDPMAGSHNPLLAGYDSEGNLLSQMDVTGRKITYGYDDANRLLTLSDDPNNALATQAIYAYDLDGNTQTLSMPNGTAATWAYTNGRLISVTHTRSANSSIIASYTTDGTSFDANGRLLHFTDNTADLTAFTYDEVNNLLTEGRTGTLNYSGAYTYDKTNLRKTAKTVTNGVTNHNGAYTYDGAGWLSTVVDSATNPAVNEAYAWYPEGMISSYPLPGNSGLTVQPDYDEEGNLISLTHIAGGATTLAYEYGYAYDGKRRWKKDYGQSAATWYPCGVACSAGELAELANTIDGSGNYTGTWQASALYLPSGAGCGAKPIRRHNVGSGNDEYHHADLFGVIGVFTDASATVYTASIKIYDRFGVARHTGPISLVYAWPVLSPYCFCVLGDDDLIRCYCSESDFLAARGTSLSNPLAGPPYPPPHSAAPGRVWVWSSHSGWMQVPIPSGQSGAPQPAGGKSPGPPNPFPSDAPGKPVGPKTTTRLPGGGTATVSTNLPGGGKYIPVGFQFLSGGRAGLDLQCSLDNSGRFSASLGVHWGF